MDVVQQIRAFNAGRDPERLALKYSKMRSDTFAFLRGACHLFYDRLPYKGFFKSAPLVWSCGDLHLENFGSYKGENRPVYFDMNDFDEGLLAPASWDVVRMLTSLRLAAHSLEIKPGETKELCATFLEAYGSALAQGKAYWVDPRTANGLVQDLLDGLGERKRGDFIDSRTQRKDNQCVIKVDGQKALPAAKADRKKVESFMADFAKAQSDPGFFKVLDVARRIAGTGSLGVERYVILVQGKGSPDGHYLLDLKASFSSSLARHATAKQPKWKSEAHRIVEMQRRLQAVPMAFLQPVFIGRQAYVLRELQASEDRVSLDGAKQSQGDIKQVIATMGRIVAWGQLRSAGRQGSAIADELMGYAQGKKWQSQLLASSQDLARQTMLDAAAFACAYDEGAFQR
ncbi:DUF2252 domain-containing protein [Polaromonas glacialis]|uniref:DUF2252 domain-containing protein n=1 Tax=Polaromonas glacialis TaxID=866564 RepID=UPI000497D9B2|nr:DUF2252 family protein [Polaromonas glacialis]